jgi:hypothetical protein
MEAIHIYIYCFLINSDFNGKSFAHGCSNERGFQGENMFNTWENHGKIRNLNYEPNN